MSIIIDLLGETKPPNNLNIALIQAPGTDQIFAGVSLLWFSRFFKKVSKLIHSARLNSSISQSTRFDQALRWLISDTTTLLTCHWSSVL